MGIREATPLHIRQKIQATDGSETTSHDTKPKPERIHTQTATSAEQSVPV